MSGWNRERASIVAVIALAALVALISARPYAGGWNDGSRLATVESLIDHGSLAIDDSIFVKLPDTTPYEAHVPHGTLDKLLIGGHWYSDKPPVPGLLLAILYQLLQWMTGLTASLHPQAFCYVMTLLSSGLAYIGAISGIWCIGRRLELPWRLCCGVTASFALATLGLVYVRYVNNHMLLLGVTVGLLVCHVRLVQDETLRCTTLLGLGTLAGFAYSIDLGVGPPLWLGSMLLAAWRTRALKPLALVLLAALPWLAVHHAVNYSLGGTITPASAVAEYVAWPGSPFTDNYTGRWAHANFARFASYALKLLISKKGFVVHNPTLLLVPLALVVMWRTRSRWLPEALCCMLVAGGVWLVYSWGSINYAGGCVSIRWFVPLLGPGYFLLLALVRAAPQYAADFAILSLGGAAIAVTGWLYGPWHLHVVPALWPALGVSLAAWALYRWMKRRPNVASSETEAQLRRAA
jgi:hypothetical protein